MVDESPSSRMGVLILSRPNNRREVAILKIQIRFYYDLGPSTALLLCSWRFYNDSCHFDQNYESLRSQSPVEWGFYYSLARYILLTVNILDAGKQVFWQTMKTKMK